MMTASSALLAGASFPLFEHRSPVLGGAEGAVCRGQPPGAQSCREGNLGIGSGNMEEKDCECLASPLYLFYPWISMCSF